MPQVLLNITPELFNRLNDWSYQSHMPPQSLAIDLLQEYFDDCNDADRFITF